MTAPVQFSVLTHPCLPTEVRCLAEQFASPAGEGRRFLLGRNEHSAALAKVIQIDGFVDDYATDAVWNGLPVMNGVAVPRDAIIVNCSFSVWPVSASRRIQELCPRGTLEYADLMAAFPERVPVPFFIEETRVDYLQNDTRWSLLRDCLADYESCKVLDDVLRFRLSGDIRYMKSYTVRPKDQYFEPFLNLPACPVFVDGGGFDGDTTEEFCCRYPDYERVFVFEPSVVNLNKARIRLNGLRFIEFIDKGLSDQAGSLAFNPDVGSASAVSETGTCRIQVSTVDEEIRVPVSFIKMDLEGWELKALAGSQRHIHQDRPTLAIAVYHRPSDFWQICDFVLSVHSGYRVYLRHYTEGWSETVMYFVPNL